MSMSVIVTSGPPQRHHVCVPGDDCLVPVARAVGAELGDPTLLVEVAQEHLTAVSPLAGLHAPLLDLEGVAARSGRKFSTLALHPPLGQGDVGEDVRSE